MTYLKLCLSDIQSLSTILSKLKSYEGKTSNKVITEIFQVNKKYISIDNETITRKTINTIKWIDDIIDLEFRKTNNKVGFTISENESDLKNIKGHLNKFILLNPKQEIINELENWSLIKNVLKKEKKIEFNFDFYSALQYSKKINLKTKNGIAEVQTVEIKSHKKLFTIFSKNVKPGIVNVRIHHMCETSEIFDSIHCDCKEQLEAFKKIIFKDGGILIYAHEEGRGFGLTHKINAYYNTERYGMDTVDAMVKEAHKSENRMFEIPADILLQMGITEVNIWTNNPLKINPLIDRGIKVNRKEAWYKVKSKEAKKYTEDKRKKMNHIEINN